MLLPFSSRLAWTSQEGKEAREWTEKGKHFSKLPFALSLLTYHWPNKSHGQARMWGHCEITKHWEDEKRIGTSVSLIYYILHVCTLSCFSHVQLFASKWTVAHQDSLSMGFSRQEKWSGLPCPPPQDRPNSDLTRFSYVSYIGRWILYC